MDEGDFEKAAAKLREREYPYFLASNKDMIRIPSIGFVAMDAAYFNFVYYIAWKIVSQNVTGAEARTAFNRDVGRNMLRQLTAEGATETLAVSRTQLNGIAHKRLCASGLIYKN